MAIEVVRSNTNLITADVVYQPPMAEVPSMPAGSTVFSESDRCLTTSLGNDVYYNAGQELFGYGKNENGDIINGTPVKVTGSSGNRLSFEPARADEPYGSFAILGLATEDIRHNSLGLVTPYGNVRAIDLTGYDEGDQLFLGATGGSSDTPPAKGNRTVFLGIVLKGGPQGTVWVNPIPLPFIGELSDVDTTGTAQFVHRDPDTGIFKMQEQYVDIDHSIVIRTTGPNIPVLATVFSFGGEDFKCPQWAVNDFAGMESQENVHSWAEGTQFNIHVHTLTGAQDATDRYVRWRATYMLVDVNGQCVGGQIDSGDLLIPANTPAGTMLLQSLGTINMSGRHIGGHSKFILRRIASTGAAPSVNPFCEMLQAHILLDSAGSRSISTK